MQYSLCRLYITTVNNTFHKIIKKWPYSFQHHAWDTEQLDLSSPLLNGSFLNMVSVTGASCKTCCTSAHCRSSSWVIVCFDSVTKVECSSETLQCSNNLALSGAMKDTVSFSSSHMIMVEANTGPRVFSCRDSICTWVFCPHSTGWMICVSECSRRILVSFLDFQGTWSSASLLELE